MGDAVELAPGDHNGNGYLLRIGQELLFAHIDIRSVQNGVIEGTDGVDVGADDVGVGGSRVISRED